jgi:hypothetical protein
VRAQNIRLRIKAPQAFRCWMRRHPIVSSRGCKSDADYPLFHSVCVVADINWSVFWQIAALIGSYHESMRDGSKSGSKYVSMSACVRRHRSHPCTPSAAAKLKPSKTATAWWSGLCFTTAKASQQTVGSSSGPI